MTVEESKTGLTSVNQQQTAETFGFKWGMRHTYDSEQVQDRHRHWLMERYCANDPKCLDDWLSGGNKTILDAGCGSGFSGLLFFGDYLKNNQYIGVDIAEEAIEVAQQRSEEMGYQTTFLVGDLMDVPIPDQSVDMIFSEGVLHHTDNTKEAIQALSHKLKPQGLFLFYVYAKKAVVREFTDDYIREAISGLSNEEAWEVLKPLTKLGMALGELDVQIDVPEDIPYLGIKKGQLDLQRFFYWNICKTFYHPTFNLDEMNHINLDWFRPANCHRQTPEEVVSFCEAAGLDIEQMNTQESGITVVARRR